MSNKEEILELSKQDIQKLADLAHIELDESEKQELETDINLIINMIEVMQKIDTSDIEPVTHPLADNLRLRPDKVVHDDKLKVVMSNAPKQDENLFVVPKVIE